MTSTRPVADELLSWRNHVDADQHLPYSVHRDGFAEWGSISTRRHTHADFAELFWVETGRAIHEINGLEHPVVAGDLVFVATDDVHRYRAASVDFVIVNVAIPNGIVNDFVDRYVGSAAELWRASVPRVLRPVSHEMERIVELGHVLGNGRPSRLRVDHFLMELLLLLDGPVPTESPMPLWLTQALELWRGNPAAMQAGVSGIADLSRRSREHVSRTLRQATGRRAVDVVNTLRMDYATWKLRMSDDSITRIAAESGLANLSHFYDVFKRHYGTTPREYRMSRRRATNPVR